MRKYIEYIHFFITDMLRHWHSPLHELFWLNPDGGRLLLSVMVNRSKLTLKQEQDIVIKLDSHKVIKSERSLVLMSVSDTLFTLFPCQPYWV